MKHIILLLSVVLLTTACIREEAEFTVNSQTGNFEALWTIIDRQYCFLDYKHVNWDSIHDVYAPRVAACPTNTALFEVLCDMLAELRDGHVNLSYAGDMGHYWSWYEEYPNNFDTELQEAYLGTGYQIAAGLKYRLLDDNIAYVVCNSFMDGFGEGNLDHVMNNMALADGMIIDVRNNTGGSLKYAGLLSQRFTNKRIIVGYTLYKTGPGHDEFSTPQPEYLDPSNGLRWQKPVIVLTNRRCYSATNTFVRNMHACPKVRILGDQTGGGSGLPFMSELPNGWIVRFSASPMLDADKRHIEFGIKPDIEASLDLGRAQNGEDSMIEMARSLLHQ